MNFTQSFEEFSRGLGPTDLMLYAGVGLIIWVLFKDKLAPMNGLYNLVLENIKNLFTKKQPDLPNVVTVSTNTAPVILANTISAHSKLEPEDLFFKLVVSWKETRDLALKCGCKEAVDVADEMFPYLSPNVCGKDNVDE